MIDYKKARELVDEYRRVQEEKQIVFAQDVIPKLLLAIEQHAKDGNEKYFFCPWTWQIKTDKQLTIIMEALKKQHFKLSKDSKLMNSTNDDGIMISWE